MERDPRAKLSSTRASSRKRALVEATKSLGRSKLKDPPRDTLRGHQEQLWGNWKGLGL